MKPAWVPLPAPGPPSNIRRIGPTPLRTALINHPLSLAAAPLVTRRDTAAALEALAAPLARQASAGGARLDLGFNLAQHSDDCAGIESFARPLWGLAPWAAGGGSLEAHGWILRGLAHAFDPAHPEYWGEPTDYDQRCVEFAAVAAAMLIAPTQLRDPLGETALANIAAWVGKVNARQLPDNNWLFFRVLANLALARAGLAHDAARMAADLDRIESFDLGEGWYSDGPNEQRDHYVAFSLHYCGLLYATFASESDPQRCERLRDRAARFAKDYAAWFDAEGNALPFGRSLSYRFAQGAFWGALAYAGVEALPWPEIKGLWLRNLRGWLSRPIIDERGILMAGYAYPNDQLGEQYNGPGSAYLAFKAFLPLALPESHAFWQAAEGAPPTKTSIAPQPHARFLVCRADEGRHVFALNAGQWAAWGPRHDAAKYAKFCYSTRFGFSVPSSAAGLEASASDSMLVLSEEGTYFRARRETFEHEVHERFVVSTWKPWRDVEVRTWLIAAPPWHFRVHRIRSPRPLAGVETGFAVPWIGIDRQDKRLMDADQRRAAAGEPTARCEILDLEGGRQGAVFLANAATNVLVPRTVIPALVADFPSGETWLACAVLGTVMPDPPASPFTWKTTFKGFRLEAPDFALDFNR